MRFSKLPKAHAKTAKQIMEAVADVTGFTPQELGSRDKGKALAAARQAAIFILKQQIADLTYDDIGQLFGRDRTTVFRTKRDTAVRIVTDPEFAEYVKTIQKQYVREKR